MGEIIKEQIIDESMVGTAMYTDAYVRYLQAKLKTVTLERDALQRDLRWVPHFSERRHAPEAVGLD